MKRMKTIKEMYDQLKGFFADKTSADEQDMTSFASVNGNRKLSIKELGVVSSSSLISSKGITSSGIYSYSIDSRDYVSIISIIEDSLTCVTFKYGDIYYRSNTTFSTSTFLNLYNAQYYRKVIDFYSVASLNSNISGTIQFGQENSTLHIKGLFSIQNATIPAGTKLFTAAQIDYIMTHGSAINSGTAGNETFVGLSIQTNGDVYNLAPLILGTTYRIAVTATM